MKIIVLFKHAQPCPSSNWKIYYNVSGGIKVLEDDGGRLVDARTYVRLLTVKAVSNGTLTVIFKYGSSCPYGDGERVEVKVGVVESPRNFESATTLTREVENTTAVIKEYGNVIEITGIVEEVDTQYSIIVVNGYPIHVRGTWITSDGRVLNRKSVVAELKPGMEVTTICKVTRSSELKALKIIAGKLTYTRMKG